jgi:SAM-dependent methyltransferase
MLEALRVARAIATNQVARFAPAAYVRLTGQTGRGDASTETAQGIADYFVDCVDDYARQLDLAGDRFGAFLAGKTLLEYGPGDMPGVALWMVSLGAHKVWCVDRFPMVSLSERNLEVVRRLAERCSGEQRRRLLSCFRDPADPASGFDPARIEYVVAADGLSGLHAAVDFVFSRAVLEHVNDLEASFRDMLAALRPGALAIHQVDLRSHGLHRHNPLDFLAWSPALWEAMFSAKGVPNRWRVDRYRDILGRLGVELRRLAPTLRAAPGDVAAVRPQLAEPFRGIDDEDLAWLGFWCIFAKPVA